MYPSVAAAMAVRPKFGATLLDVPGGRGTTRQACLDRWRATQCCGVGESAAAAAGDALDRTLQVSPISSNRGHRAPNSPSYVPYLPSPRRSGRPPESSSSPGRRRVDSDGGQLDFGGDASIPPAGLRGDLVAAAGIEIEKGGASRRSQEVDPVREENNEAFTVAFLTWRWQTL